MYYIGEQLLLRRACAYAQSRQSLFCSQTQSVEAAKVSGQTLDT